MEFPVSAAMNFTPKREWANSGRSMIFLMRCSRLSLVCACHELGHQTEAMPRTPKMNARTADAVLMRDLQRKYLPVNTFRYFRTRYLRASGTFDISREPDVDAS